MVSNNLKKYLQLLSQHPDRVQRLMLGIEQDVQKQKEAAIQDAALSGITLTEADFAIVAEPGAEPAPDTGRLCLCVVGGGGGFDEGGGCGCALLGGGVGSGGKGEMCTCVGWGHGS